MESWLWEASRKPQTGPSPRVGAQVVLTVVWIAVPGLFLLCVLGGRQHYTRISCQQTHEDKQEPGRGLRQWGRKAAYTELRYSICRIFSWF